MCYRVAPDAIEAWSRDQGGEEATRIDALARWMHTPMRHVIKGPGSIFINRPFMEEFDYYHYLLIESLSRIRASGTAIADVVLLWNRVCCWRDFWLAGVRRFYRWRFHLMLGKMVTLQTLGAGGILVVVSFLLCGFSVRMKFTLVSCRSMFAVMVVNLPCISQRCPTI